MRRNFAVAVFDVDQTGGDAPAEDALGGLCHRRASFTRADHEDVAETREIAASEVADHGVHGVGRRQRGAKNGERLAA